MTQALNFTTKAIADLEWMANSPALSATDRQGVAMLADVLHRAEVFQMPNSGELIDRGVVRAQMAGEVYRPPFPAVALAYSVSQPPRRYDPAFEAVTSSRRIALIWTWDGRCPDGSLQEDDLIGKSVVITSICYLDHMRRWTPTAIAMQLPFEPRFIKAPPSHHVVALHAVGRITAEQMQAPKIAGSGVFLITPNAFAGIATSHGIHQAMELMTSDLMDEIAAYRDLCEALAARTHSFERWAQPERLNRARARAGKAPLKDFHVLVPCEVA